jgi:predicted enzyme related to lactoylglutathione lyase
MTTSDPSIHQALVVFAKNTRRVAAFYQQALDLQVLEDAASHQLLRGHGIELVVHAIPRRIAAGITIGKPPRPREDVPLKPVFVVADLEAVRRVAQATGGALKPAEAAWHFRGATVLDGWDPEGNIVQFRQLDPPV